MARLTAEQWEQARAEYEVRGISLGEVSKRFGVATSTVSRRAKTGGWTQGQMQDLAKKKVSAIKALAAVETQTQELSLRFQYTIETVVQEQLHAEGVLASLDVALAAKAIELTRMADTPEAWEVLTRGRRNLAPRPQPQQTGPAPTTVNVLQQQAAMLTPSAEMPETLRAVLRGERAGD